MENEETNSRESEGEIEQSRMSKENLIVLIGIVRDKFSELPLTIKEISQDTNIPVSVIAREAALYLRMRIVVEGFLDPSVTMKEVREKACVSPATAHRYLNDKTRIEGYFGEATYFDIQEKLDKTLTKAERDARLAILVRKYIKSEITIEQLAELTGYTRSTIQRDLNDQNRIIRVFGVNGKAVNSLVQERLALALEQAPLKGCQSSAFNRTVARIEAGKNSGNRKK